MANCVFCKIVAGEIPSKKIYEDESVLAFYDIEPQAPVHFLVIPKDHIENAGCVTSQNSKLIAHIFEIISKLADELKLKSFRVVTNSGTDAGQTVFHLHFHMLAGGVLGAMA